MANTANCIICGSSDVKTISGHVHFETRIVLASWCNLCGKLKPDEIRSKRNITPICAHSCYGRWISRDGLRGTFKRLHGGKPYPATDELK
jgi:hypothetical protein